MLLPVINIVKTAKFSDFLVDYNVNILSNTQVVKAGIPERKSFTQRYEFILKRSLSIKSEAVLSTIDSMT